MACSGLKLIKPDSHCNIFMGVFVKLSSFPAFSEIQELFKNYRNSPAFQAELEKLVVYCLNMNADKIKRAAKAGHDFYDFEEPIGFKRQLREMNYSEADFYRLLEARLRQMGYVTLLSIHNDNTNDLFCELLISW